MILSCVGMIILEEIKFLLDKTFVLVIQLHSQDIKSFIVKENERGMMNMFNTLLHYGGKIEC